VLIFDSFVSFSGLFWWCDVSWWFSARQSTDMIGAAALDASSGNVMTRVRSAWVREERQVQHDLDLLVERVGHAQRPFHRDVRRGVAALGLLNLALEVANRFEVLGHGGAVTGAQRPLQTRQLRPNVVEDARVLLQTPQTGVGLAPSPNRRSNTTRGLFSLGLGTVGERHEIDASYRQL